VQVLTSSDSESAQSDNESPMFERQKDDGLVPTSKTVNPATRYRQESANSADVDWTDRWNQEHDDSAQVCVCVVYV
jgi:hypothetical protein